MISVTDVVRGIIKNSEVAQTALRGGYLNLSAYADHIHSKVEKTAKKDVQKGTIVVALSRIADEVADSESVIPEVKIDDLSVKSSLVEITYDRTKSTLTALNQVYENRDIKSAEYFSVTQGTTEITIITSPDNKENVLEVFKPTQPKALLENLVGISVRFTEDYITQPNIIYALLRSLAMQRIVIVELISTYTELTFILNKEDLHRAFSTLNNMFSQ